MKQNERAERTFAVYEQARKKKGVSDYSVSKSAGLRPSIICDWKHGRYTPGFEKLALIARVVEIPLEAFLK